MWSLHWNAWAVDKKILRESLYCSILYRSILFCSQACHGIVLNSSEQICMSRNFLNATCLVEVTHPWRLWTFCGLCFICWRECLCEWCMRPRHSRRPLPWKFGCRGVARWCKMVLPSWWVFCFWALLNYFSRERLRRVLRKKAAVILDLHTFTPADLDLHTFTPADLDLHTLTSADLHLHTFTSADLHRHTFTPADLDLRTFTPADLDLHTFTPSHLQI